MIDIPAGWAAVIAALIAVGGTALGLLGAWLRNFSKRLRFLEHRDRLSWLYIRSLIDHGYKHAPGVPLPEPPKGWLDEDTQQ